jgi:hypothetical protein
MLAVPAAIGIDALAGDSPTVVLERRQSRYRVFHVILKNEQWMGARWGDRADLDVPTGGPIQRRCPWNKGR